MEIHEASTNELAAQLLQRLIKEAGGDQVVTYLPSLMLRIQAHLSVALLEMHINHSKGN
mgnify:CR=1 FL=1